jgi:phage terminase large subunit
MAILVIVMATIAISPLERFLATAKAAGCPADQVLNFRRGGYVAQPKQLLFHAACREADHPDGPTEIGYGGARGPGKSHALLAQMALDDCQRYPGIKGLLLRKVGKAVRESFEDLRLKVLPAIPHDYRRSDGVLQFPNGSRIILGHFKDERDVEAYLGLEYDLIGVEEATTLSSSKYKAIQSCVSISRSRFFFW